MRAVILGSEAVGVGIVTPYALRSKYVAIHPDVYIPRGLEVDAAVRAKAAFLWSRRRDIARLEALARLGWTVIRVTAEDNTGSIIHRVEWGRGACQQPRK